MLGVGVVLALFQKEGNLAQTVADIDSPIGPALLERHPSPTDTRSLGEKRLESFLARSAYSGRRVPTELLIAPNATMGELEQDVRRSAVIGLVAAVRPIVEQVSQIAGAARTHPDGAIFLALFGDRKSVITAAGLLTEIGDNRARYPTSDSLAAAAGQAPVTI